MDKEKKLKSFITGELQGWKTWEVLWLLGCCAAILSLSVYWKDSLMGMVSATAGVACVVCTGKGKLSAYAFGIVNILLYSIIAYQAKFYGEVMLNILYYFPMQFYGMYVWSNHMNPDTHEVEKREMGAKGKALLYGCVAIATIVYGCVLKLLGGTLPFADALSTVISVVAMVVSIKMYIEQWILWLVVDAVTVVMWAFAFAKGNDSAATLLMWIVYLGNAIVMYVKWSRETKPERAPFVR